MGGRALWLLGSLAVWGPPSSSTPRPAGPSLLHWTDTPASGTYAARPGRAGDGREATSPLREGGPLSLTHLLHSELGPSMLYGLTEAGPRGGQGAGADCRRSPQHAPWQRPRPVPRPLCAPALYPRKWGSSEVLLRRLTCRAWCRPRANVQLGPSSKAPSPEMHPSAPRYSPPPCFSAALTIQGEAVASGPATLFTSWYLRAGT